MEQALDAQTKHENMLLAKPNVVGVAVGYKRSKGEVSDELAVVTLVQQKKPLAALSAEDVIPEEVGGVRTDVYEIGYVRAFGAAQGRFRPVMPSGVSMGHYKVTAGTLGAVVTERDTGEKFLLSNNHIFANANDARPGDAILQPAAMDGGQNPGDMVARLERFVRLRFDDEAPSIPDLPDLPSPGTNRPIEPPQGCDWAQALAGFANLFGSMIGAKRQLVPQARPSSVASAQAVTDVVNQVDCAIARPIDPAMFSDDVLGIGPVSGTKPVELGMRVRKNGRTTDYSEGAVTLLNATVSVAYGARSARFGGQVIAEGMSQGGDSGALIVDVAEPRAVGLLFAGSVVATIFSPIDRVLDALNITF